MIKVAIVGFGNIGKAAYEAVSNSRDISLECIVETRAVAVDVPLFQRVSELDKNHIDAAILCLPSRAVFDAASSLLSRGICTVDCYDMHANIPEMRRELDKLAKQHRCAAITAAGWDPGSDSVVRAMLAALLPKGITYTNFGPGMSMGHTVAAKAVSGVKDALSVTIPLGAGVHRRMVYVELEQGADIGTVTELIRQDEYFAHDETRVIQVENVDLLKDAGHAVTLSRKGVSGSTGNQRIEFRMSIDNPALTGQILVSSARAVLKQNPGCYTMIQIPPIDFLTGETDALIRDLV